MAGDDGNANGTVGAQPVSCWSRARAWWQARHWPKALVGVVLVVLAVALAVLAFNKAPNLYTAPEPPAPDQNPVIVAARESSYAARDSGRQAAIATTRASVLAALAGLGALVTIWINYRNSRTQLQTLATTQETFRVTERGHLTDRYAKAIEQLGDAEHLPIRLGGIYALQQLALDTPEPGDRNTVREVLAAFIRTAFDEPRATAVSLGPVGSPRRRVRRDPWPPIDLRAALNVLGRTHRAGEPQADLQKAGFGHADLAGLNLSGVDLTGARLHRANLSDARLINANLRFAELVDARMQQTVLVGACLSHTNLEGAHLAGADLQGADLTGASFAGAHLVGVSFAGANLTRANLRDANAARANLTGANLAGANLAGADLLDVDLSQTLGWTDQQLASVRRHPNGAPGPSTRAPTQDEIDDW